MSKKIFKIKYFINILDLNNYKNSKFLSKIRVSDIKELNKVSNKFDFINIKIMFLKKQKPNKKIGERF